MHRSIALAAVALIGGCDVVNCIVDRYPQFSSDSLATGTLNQEYNSTLQADIHSSTEDNGYDYRVTLEGSLPPGLSLQTSGRGIFFTGTPTKLGDYTFTLNLYAAPNYPGPGINLDNQASALCENDISQEFEISVVQGF